MSQIRQTLMYRLEAMGLELDLVPGFLRNLAQAALIQPQATLAQINGRLHYLGWQGIEVDYHTYQLALAFFEDRHSPQRFPIA
jgi:hypothetical protein